MNPVSLSPLNYWARTGRQASILCAVAHDRFEPRDLPVASEKGNKGKMSETGLV